MVESDFLYLKLIFLKQSATLKAMKIEDSVFVYRLSGGDRLSWHGRYHAHEAHEFEIHFFIEGAGQFQCNRTRYPISHGTLFLTGPYEFHPHNPLLSSYGHPEIRLQKSGHASWCDTPDGRSYLAFLCVRPLPGTLDCVLGRETSIVELEWRDDWPYLKPAPGEELFPSGAVRNWPADSFEPPVVLDEYRKKGEFPPATKSIEYRFDGSAIHPDFKNLRTERDPEVYSLTSRPGFLSLRGGQSPVSHWGQSLLARRQTDFSFSAETKLEFAPTSFQHLAGLCWRYDETNQYLCALTFDENLGRVLKVLTFVDRQFMHYDPVPVPGDGPVWLGLTVQVDSGRFRYSPDGKTWRILRPVLSAAVLSDEFGGMGFTGAFTGMFCIDTLDYTARAYFESFKYTVL